MDRHDFAERAARHASRLPTDTFDEIESARMRLGLRLGAHPAQNLVGIGQEGEDGGGRCRDMGLAPDDERSGHRSLLRAPPMPEGGAGWEVADDKGTLSSP